MIAWRTPYVAGSVKREWGYIKKTPVRIDTIQGQQRGAKKCPYDKHLTAEADETEEFCPGLGVGLEAPVNAARHGSRTLFLNASHDHAHVPGQVQ